MTHAFNERIRVELWGKNTTLVYLLSNCR